KRGDGFARSPSPHWRLWIWAAVLCYKEAMNRRRLIQSVLGVSAVPLLAQRSNLDSSQSPSPPNETPTLAANAPDAVAAAVPRFFDAQGFSALRRLGEILVPPRQNAPGAMEAEAAEFLDFLIG